MQKGQQKIEVTQEINTLKKKKQTKKVKNIYLT